jgi:biotin transport system substrate-specific component
VFFVNYDFYQEEKIMSTEGLTIRQSVYAALFAALMGIASYIIIPVGPIPVTFQCSVLFLAALLLQPLWAFVAVIVYLLAGIAGLPVFAGGSSGLAVFLGPSGGYLVGFALTAPLTSFLHHKFNKNKRLVPAVIAIIAGWVAMYLVGVPWLKVRLDLSWHAALYSGWLVFIIADSLKVVVVLFIYKILLKTGLNFDK